MAEKSDRFGFDGESIPIPPEVDYTVPGQFRCKTCGAVSGTLLFDVTAPDPKPTVKGCTCGETKGG